METIKVNLSPEEARIMKKLADGTLTVGELVKFQKDHAQIAEVSQTTKGGKNNAR